MSWTAYVTYRWAQGIIDVVDADSVDMDGDLTANDPLDGAPISVRQGNWHLTAEPALEQANQLRAAEIERLRGEITERTEQIRRLELLEFSIQRPST